MFHCKVKPITCNRDPPKEQAGSLQTGGPHT